jgi:hypothetical protein
VEEVLIFEWKKTGGSVDLFWIGDGLLKLGAGKDYLAHFY